MSGSGPGYQRNGGVITTITNLSDQVENFVIADEDEFETADAAPVASERWAGEEYVVGAGSTSTGDINTTTAGKAYVGALPGGAFPATGYWLRHMVSRKSRFYSVTSDMDVTWGAGIPGTANDDLAGIIITKGAAYDANNYFMIARGKSSTPTDYVIAFGVLGGVPTGAVTSAITSDAVAFKIERFNNVWKFYYSIVQHPNYDWVFAGQFEDAANAMTTVTSIGLAAYTNGTAGDCTVEADFDHFAFYISSEAIFQALANGYDSSLVAADRDGDLMQRSEFIIEMMDAESLLVTDWSQSGPVEEGALEEFAIYLYDKRAGAIALADIDITGISVELARSRGGAAFSAAGITQPTFAKANGMVDTQCAFLVAEWQVGDMYRLKVSGITADIDGETLPIQAITWCNVVHEALNIDTYVKANSFLDGVWVDAALGTAGTAYPIGTPTTPVAGLADALTIATARKVSKIYLVQGAHALPAGTWSNFQFIGTSPGVSLDIANRTSTNCLFVNLSLTGTAPSVINAKECIIPATLLMGASTYLERCRITGIAVNADSIYVYADNCYFIGATVDVNSKTTTTLRFTHASGTLSIQEMVDAPSTCDIYADDMQIAIAASCTLGTIQIWGNFRLDNATGGATVNVLPTDLGRDGIWVSTAQGVDGASWPAGAETTPVATLTSAHALALARNVSRIYILDGAHALPALDFSNMQIIGTSRGVTLDLANRTCANAQFTNLTLSGILLSTAHIVDCTVNISCVASTNFTRSHIIGVQVDTDSITIRMDDCTYDATIDFDSLIAEFNLAHASGYIQLVNMADAGSEFNAQCDSLFINIGASNTAGTANLYGTKYLTGAGGGCTINNFLESAIHTTLDARLMSKTFWSKVQPTMTIPAVAANLALESITLPNYPWTIDHVWVIFKFRKTEDTSGARNNLNGDSDIQVQKAAGAWIDAIHCDTNIWDTLANAESGGDIIVGNIDVVGQVDAMNQVINFQTDLMQADGADLVLHDVQVGLQIWYHMT